MYPDNLSALTIQAARTVDPKGRSWNRLKTAINQPDFIDDPATLKQPTSAEMIHEIDYGTTNMVMSAHG